MVNVVLNRAKPFSLSFRTYILPTLNILDQSLDPNNMLLCIFCQLY